MTAEEFKAHGKEEGGKRRKHAYYELICTTLAGVFLCYYAYATNDVSIFIIWICAICLGIFAIWLLSKRQQVFLEIQSNTTIQKKVEVLNGFASTYKMYNLSIDEDIYS